MRPIDRNLFTRRRLTALDIARCVGAIGIAVVLMVAVITLWPCAAR
jgi:hypothetical protein